MKSTIISIFLIVLCSQVNGQIFNEGFEDWASIKNYESPNGWQTNQDTNFKRLEKDTQSVSGEYSVKLIPSSHTAWSDCQSRIWLNKKLNSAIGENKCVTFYIKSDLDLRNRTGRAYCRIFGKYVSSEIDSFVRFDWTNYNEIDEFEKKKIRINFEKTDSIEITIAGSATSTAVDGCASLSNIWIDELQIENCENVTSAFEEGEIWIKTYPNPSSQRIKIESNHEDLVRYEIINSRGQLNSRRIIREPISGNI